MFYEDDDEIKFYNNKFNIINNIIKDKEISVIDIENLKIDDYVYIIFTPDSQRYIYNLTPKIGTVKNILSKNKYINNFPDIIILNDDNVEENLLHGSYSLYGSLGYSFIIYLIK